MGELSIGVESGNDEVLAYHQKGVKREDNYQALLKLEECNISYSTYIMLGLGGKGLSREHAIDTASLLSKVNPQVMIVVTLVLFKDAKLVKSVRNKEFVRINILEQMREEKILLENLYMKNTIFNGTHKTNAINIKRKTSRAQEFVAG